MHLFLLSLLGCPLPSDDTADDSGKVDDSGTVADSGDSGDTDSGVTDTDTGKDTGTALAPVVTALVSMDPATLPSATGGAVTFLANVQSDQPLDTWTDAANVFIATLPSGETLPVKVSVEGERLAFTLRVPAGLAPDGARLGAPLTMNGAAVTTLPIALSADHAAITKALGAPHWNAIDATPQESCGAWADDSDGDGVVEVLTVGIQDECTIVAQACPTDGGSCKATKLDACDEKRTALCCRDTGRLRVTDDAPTVTVAAVDTARTLYTSGTFTWADGAWSSTSTTALFGIVLAINNTKKQPENPDLGSLLAVDEGFSTFTVPRADATTFKTASIGTLTPKSLTAGTAWVGLFSAGDLSAAVGEDLWIWAFDGSAADKGTLTGSVYSPLADSDSLSRVRDLTLTAPDFAIEHLVASGEDLDGDGAVELFVEAFGEGRHAIWLVPGATDKSDSRPVRSLSQPCDATEGDDTCAGATFVNGDATLSTLTFAEPTLTLAGDRIVSTGLILTDAPLDDAPDHGIWTTAAWTVADAMLDDATAVDPDQVGVLGQAQLRPGDSTGRGLCSRGRCFCTPGFSGASERVTGPGTGGKDPDAALAAGDLAFIGPDTDGDGLLVGRALHPDLDQAGLPLATIRNGGEVVTAGWARHIGGGNVVFTDSTITVLGGSTLSVDGASSGGGLRVNSAQNPDTRNPTLTFADEKSASGAYTLPEDTRQGGASTPVRLGEARDAEGGGILFWRDGQGQAWIARADLDAAVAGKGGELPLLEGPFALGTPVPGAETLLGEHDGAPAAMVVNGQIVADTPFLSMEDLESRVVIQDGDPGDWVCDSSVSPDLFVTVGGGEGCPFQTWLLPAAASLSDAVAAAMVVSESADSTCADLEIPALSVAALPDAPEVGVFATPGGSLTAKMVDCSGTVTSASLAVKVRDGYAGGVQVSAGDLDGDGLGDLLIVGLADDPVLLWSDGRGGFVDAGDGATWGDLRGILGSGPGRGGVVHPDGGLTATVSRTYLEPDDFPTGW